MFDGAFHLPAAEDRSLPASTLVFVQSRDGNTGAADPSALGGGEVDLHLIYEGLSRVAADAVLVGATTVQGNDVVFSCWHPEIVALRAAYGLPRHPAQIVATTRGLPFDRTLLFNLPELRVVLVAPQPQVDQVKGDLARRPWIRPVVMSDPTQLRSA